MYLKTFDKIFTNGRRPGRWFILVLIAITATVCAFSYTHRDQLKDAWARWFPKKEAKPVVEKVEALPPLEEQPVAPQPPDPQLAVLKAERDAAKKEAQEVARQKSDLAEKNAAEALAARKATELAKAEAAKELETLQKKLAAAEAAAKAAKADAAAANMKAMEAKAQANARQESEKVVTAAKSEADAKRQQALADIQAEIKRIRKETAELLRPPTVNAEVSMAHRQREQSAPTKSWVDGEEVPVDFSRFGYEPKSSQSHSSSNFSKQVRGGQSDIRRGGPPRGR